ncbi:MAG: serine/threonine protein kinase, partial [Oligoflexia bacterium]|nr:serine/threonine protein kinase [Oligoflexia bacterium]
MSTRLHRQLAPGDELGRYRITEVLSSGPGGVVYRVRHLDLGVDRALKVCHLRGPEAIQRFSQAARIQAGLRHPNLVGVVDVIDVGGSPALVLELVEGPTLAELLRDAPPRLDEATRLFMDILAGMACAHAAGVVHRDLKPSNIVLDLTATPPAARVTDFGIAQAVDSERGPAHLGFCGTPAWCAPELLSGELATEAGPQFSGDVYALGALLYTLATGQVPFPQVDFQALLQAKSAPSTVDPSVAAGQPLPAAITATIARCLHPNPTRRPADAVAIQEMLAQAGDGVQAAPRRARASPLTTLLACALAGSVALSIVFAAKWSKSDRRARAGSLELAAARVSPQDPAAALALLRAAAV